MCVTSENFDEMETTGDAVVVTKDQGETSIPLAIWGSQWRYIQISLFTFHGAENPPVARRDKELPVQYYPVTVARGNARVPAVIFRSRWIGIFFFLCGEHPKRALPFQKWENWNQTNSQGEETLTAPHGEGEKRKSKTKKNAQVRPVVGQGLRGVTGKIDLAVRGSRTERLRWAPIS